VKAAGTYAVQARYRRDAGTQTVRINHAHMLALVVAS